MENSNTNETKRDGLPTSNKETTMPTNSTTSTNLPPTIIDTTKPSSSDSQPVTQPSSSTQTSTTKAAPTTSHTPTRAVHCQDAVAWLEAQSFIAGSVVTSLPDVCEVPMSLPEWKIWFSRCVTLILSKLLPHECAIFYQTDVKQLKQGKFVEWIDKSYLCHKGAEQVPECHLVWHKIMSFKTDITIATATRKKAGYSHMLCYRKDTSMHFETLPDVSPRGRLIWPKGMGFDACFMAVKYAKKFGSTCIVDPFCGKGSVLAVANYLGMDAIGVELCSSRARNAHNLMIDTESGKFIWNEEERKGGEPNKKGEGQRDVDSDDEEEPKTDPAQQTGQKEKEEKKNKGKTKKGEKAKAPQKT
eukprot:Phypoly_transcript_09819.p1 GENE.Phypoly_transcript_09819~~Phypoly_transcript_09819.p1  ORF type:complete len:358 (+),score=65.00 Phypoly_transcript_09819:44-1117(+)